MKIFQICNGYFDIKLYRELFDKLDTKGCINKIFVFTWNKSNLNKKNNENKKLKVIDTDSYSKFMPNEKVITPTFIIMNQEYLEIGKWVQYPKRIIDVVESKDQFEL